MFGQYAAFILPSYAITLVVIAALIAWIVLVHRSRRREIADLEGRGISRAHARPSPGERG